MARAILRAVSLATSTFDPRDRLGAVEQGISRAPRAPDTAVQRIAAAKSPPAGAQPGAAGPPQSLRSVNAMRAHACLSGELDGERLKAGARIAAQHCMSLALRRAFSHRR